jgi:hypothetical protein
VLCLVGYNAVYSVETVLAHLDAGIVGNGRVR